MTTEHSHSHHHDRPHASYQALRFTFWIIAGFMGVEIVCGWLFHSLALLSDGFHMLSDAISLGVSSYAVALSVRKPNAAKTFGYKRFEILAAFGNGLTLMLLSVFICFQAIHRFWHPENISAKPMLWVALLGLAVNIFAAWYLHRGEEKKTLNEESALWHIWGDLFSSIAAIIAALGILFWGLVWLDPFLSLLIACIIGWGGFRVIRRSAHILVEGAPEGFDLEAVRQHLSKQNQVESVHDLHVWTMNGRDIYLSAHVAYLLGASSEKEVLQSLTHSLREDFHIEHITLQLGPCSEADCNNNC